MKRIRAENYEKDRQIMSTGTENHDKRQTDGWTEGNLNGAICNDSVMPPNP